ncbi:calcium-binding protein [Corticibacterium sp. UT-5YL-CI-8]|nr:calcium-binding protein [Tianweitania sp. UT-5YL-CI-8]
MLGKGGDDTYYVDNVGDRVVEVDGEGNDTVIASISYSLKAIYAENINLVGAGVINATGNKFSNVIVGNSSSNIINGMAGNDVLTGGGGSDRFVFDTSLGTNNVDHLTDFYAPQDSIRLDDSVFVGLTEGALIAKAQFKNIATGTVDASDRILYDSDTGNLFFDRDGSGSSYAPVQFAVIDSKEALTYRDFLVI